MRFLLLSFGRRAFAALSRIGNIKAQPSTKRAFEKLSRALSHTGRLSFIEKANARHKRRRVSAVRLMALFGVLGAAPRQLQDAANQADRHSEKHNRNDPLDTPHGQLLEEAVSQQRADERGHDGRAEQPVVESRPFGE